VRYVIPAAVLFAAALHPIAPLAQSAPACAVRGSVTSSTTRLPGVVLSLAAADGHQLDVTASAADGTYAIAVPGPGRYTLKAEFFAFAPVTRELTVDRASCDARLDLSMTLA
jgi:hypothetical protein